MKDFFIFEFLVAMMRILWINWKWKRLMNGRQKCRTWAVSWATHLFCLPPCKSLSNLILFFSFDCFCPLCLFHVKICCYDEKIYNWKHFLCLMSQSTIMSIWAVNWATKFPPCFTSLLYDFYFISFSTWYLHVMIHTSASTQLI